MAIPSPNPIPNNALVSFSYIVSPTITNSTSTISNTITTQFNLATITNRKTVDKVFANVGDTIIYTITIFNSGNVTANNILFIDTIPNDTVLASGTFNQDGMNIAISPNPPGVTLPNGIAPGAISTITFAVIISTIPSPNPIPNNATTSFSYTVDPIIPNGESANLSTNTVFTQVNNANMGTFIKDVDKTFTQVGDILTYSITITNTGNITANNVHFTDTVPNGTSFVTNSLILNGVTQPGFIVSPPTGVTIGNMNPNATVTLSFKILINTIPNPNPMRNNGFVNFTFTVNPISGATVASSNISSPADTLVGISASINLVKSSQQTVVAVSDIVNYTIAISNIGNATAENLVFIDTIPNGTTFVPNSLFFNNVQQVGQSPAPPGGFSVGNIFPNGLSTISFQVQVTTLPAPNPFPNDATAKFSYVFDPNSGATVPGSSNSNTVKVFVKPLTKPIKFVDKPIASVGDTLTYTISWKNELNGPEETLVLYDTIPNDTTFVPNSVFINGVNQPGQSVAPPGGLALGNLSIGRTVTVTFQVTVNTIPSPNPIPNQALLQYTFQPDLPDPVIYTDTVPSNIVNTLINFASISSASKYVNRSVANILDILTYTIALTNTGNVTANNIVLIDTIPIGTTFIPNSVTLNGVSQPGTTVAPPGGLSVGSLAPSGVVTISFQVSIDTVPNPNPIPNTAFTFYSYTINAASLTTGNGSINTNLVNTQVNFARLGVSSKSVDKAFAIVGDNLIYTITLTNTGNVTANNVVIRDTIPNDTAFVPGSVVINGVPSIIVPIGGVLIVPAGNVSPNASSTLTFRVTVTTIPSPNPIPNNANSTFTYTIDPSIPNGGSGGSATNTVFTQVNTASLSVFKFTDKLFATCGDTITFTINVPNNGNITATNVILSDTVPNGTIFVPGSILVNGGSVGGNPSSINVGNIAPGATSTVSFQITVQC